MHISDFFITFAANFERTKMETVYHIPAMLEETLAGLNIQAGGTYVDVTLGGGGHSRAILAQLSKSGRLFSMDQDLDAYRNWVGVAAEPLDVETESLDEAAEPLDERWQFVHGNFRYLSNFMDYYGVNKIDGLLADLGVSFHHFDEAERGFSFRFAGPLDMRMNQTGGRTAADIVNTYSEEDLARVLYLYGELKNSRQLARKIVAARPIFRTEELVEVLVKPLKGAGGELGGGFGGESGAKYQDGEILDIPVKAKGELTLVFQALRMEVNDELGALREMLMAAKNLLKPGGRIAILTYHSLEDRIVKNFLRSGNLDGEIEKDFYGNILSPFKVIEKGRMASAAEVERNPRSRSAKLRVAEKIAD